MCRSARSIPNDQCWKNDIVGNVVQLFQLLLGYDANGVVSGVVPAITLVWVGRNANPMCVGRASRSL